MIILIYIFKVNTIKKLYDVVVIGGGIIGSTLSLSLAKSGFTVLIIELVPIKVLKYSEKPDLRILSMNYSSVQFLRNLGVWQKIDARFYVPYRRLETWELSFAKVIFDSSLLNLPELGFMIEHSRLQQALRQSVTKCERLTQYFQSEVISMYYDNSQWKLILSDNSIIISKLLIGADGTYSKTRKQTNIPCRIWKYHQSCLLLSVEVTSNQKDTTWQIFFPDGPRAFLPLYDKWASLVWYDNHNKIRHLQNLSLKKLEKEVSIAFPDTLGTIILHHSKSFFLTFCHAKYYIKTGLALVGDAAHTINPLAGQGANLGFRDVISLSKILISSRKKGEDWSTFLVLERYQKNRQGDNLLMQMGIDLIYKTFSNNYLPLKLTRNLCFLLIQNTESLKYYILKYALGL